MRKLRTATREAGGTSSSDSDRALERVHQPDTGSLHTRSDHGLARTLDLARHSSAFTPFDPCALATLLKYLLNRREQPSAGSSISHRLTVVISDVHGAATLP